MSGFTPVMLLQTPGTLCRGPSSGALVYDGVGPDPLQRQDVIKDKYIRHACRLRTARQATRRYEYRFTQVVAFSRDSVLLDIVITHTITYTYTVEE